VRALSYAAGLRHPLAPQRKAVRATVYFAIGA